MNPLMKLHHIFREILHDEMPYFYYKDFSLENIKIPNKQFSFIEYALRKILKYYGKERLRNFIEKSITTLNSLDWEENLLILVFCINESIYKDEFVDTLEAVLVTYVDPSYLQIYHKNETEKLKSYFHETPLKFNIMKHFLLKEIKETEEEQLEELIKKQQELCYDYLTDYGDKLPRILNPCLS